MKTETYPRRPHRSLGLLGWFSLIGLVSMFVFYYINLIIGGNGLASSTILSIGIVAGIGALLFWFGNDPTA